MRAGEAGGGGSSRNDCHNKGISPSMGPPHRPVRDLGPRPQRRRHCPWGTTAVMMPVLWAESRTCSKLILYLYHLLSQRRKLGLHGVQPPSRPSAGPARHHMTGPVCAPLAACIPATETLPVDSGSYHAPTCHRAFARAHTPLLHVTAVRAYLSPRVHTYP